MCGHRFCDGLPMAAKGRKGTWAADPQVLDGTISSTEKGSRSPRPWQEHRALDSYEALMTCPPGVVPLESLLEQNEVREVVADAFDTLSDDDLWIYHMLCNVKMSLRFTGRVIGIPKTTLARRRDKIIDSLNAELRRHPVIKERLGI